MAERIGQRLGNYTLTQLLGQGGFAEVYLGEHLYLKSQAAIKILQTRLSSTDDTDGFLREAQTIARLAHPNIIRVLDFGIDNETPYLVMDYAPNGTLRQCHPRGVPVPVPMVIPYVKQVAEALQYAHDERIIHRDIKPENMLLGRRNEVLLSDFGIALVAQSSRYEGTQDVIGTVAYMSPEQIQGKPRPASDQYSLGIVIYEWLTGERPFQGSFTEMCTQHMFAPPPPLTQKLAEISPSIEKVILRALDKDPHKRFESMREFANSLEEASGTALTERVETSTQNNTPKSTMLIPNSPVSQTQSQNIAQATQMVPGSLTAWVGEPSNPNLTGSPQQTDQPVQPEQGRLGTTIHSSETALQTSLEAQTPPQQGVQGNQSVPKLILPSYTQQRPKGQIASGAQQQYPNQQDPRFLTPAQQQYHQPELNQQFPPAQYQQPPYGGYNNAQHSNAQQYQHPSGQQYGAQQSYPGQEAQRSYQQQQAAYEQRMQQQRQQEEEERANTPLLASQTARSERASADAPEEDWFGFLGAWKWRGLATIIGLVLFCFLYDFHINIQGHIYPFALVIPLFFGGAFGLLAGLIVGAGGALFSGMLYQGTFPYKVILGSGLSLVPIVFYGLAGLATGLSMLGRRFPGIGSSIRAAFLALIVIALSAGYLVYTLYSSSRIYSRFFLQQVALPLGTSLLVDIAIAFVALLIYSICAHLIKPFD